MSQNMLIGAIGENTVLTELLWHGWAPVNLNQLVKQAPNVDILAAKGHHKVALQIKTAGPKSRSMLQLGYKTGTSIFNSKDGPQADFIIFIRLFNMRDYECYVVPVDEAERVASETMTDWIKTPKQDGAKRDKNFPACIRFEPNKNRLHVSNYKEKWIDYLDAWHLLEQNN